MFVGKSKTPSTKTPRGGTEKQPVQCFRVIGPDAYAGNNEEDAFFHTQYVKRKEFFGPYTDERRTFRKSGVDLFEDWERTDMTDNFHKDKASRLATLHDFPPLKVSNNGRMAIEDSRQQKKVFYAEEALVRNSNRDLSRNETSLRLRPDPKFKLTVPDKDGETHTLVAVFPDMDGKTPETIGSSSDCGRTGETVIGNTFSTCISTVIGTAGFMREIPASRMSNIHFSALLASMIGGFAQPSLLACCDALEGGAGYVPPQEFLEEIYNEPPTYHPQTAELLGINEWAHPLVGEAFMAAGVKAPEKERKDLTVNGYFESIKKWAHKHGHFPEMEDVSGSDPSHWEEHAWNYHFGGVVCRTGQDYITLENVNRKSEPETHFMGAFNKIIYLDKEMREEFLKFLQLRKQTKIPRSDDDRMEMVRKLFIHLRSSAQISRRLLESISQIEREAQGSILPQRPEALYFFEMYGHDPGQSFHEAYEPFTSGPAITFRVKNSMDMRRERLKQHLSLLTEDALETTRTFRFNIPELDEYLKEMETSVSIFKAEAEAKISQISLAQEFSDAEDEMDGCSRRLLREAISKGQTALYRHLNIRAPHPIPDDFGPMQVSVDLTVGATFNPDKKRTAGRFKLGMSRIYSAFKKVSGK
ncbi:hypothetical protein FUAX_17430 [Fulvitalea axinellae]|uniref:Uncharacterized protein n=2 Tax=Fulvitalea axinellae TaxID=1182444 RepID=A0AAU9D8T7_9BACT|nr:hypothetical protein FUAX_17430 [Fulvitalea axinellae]